MVNTLGLTHEHNLQFLTIRIIVDVLGKLFVDRIVLHRDIDGDAGLEVDDVLAELLNLLIRVLHLALVLLHLLQHLQLSCLRLEELLLQLVNVGGSAFKLLLQLFLAVFHAIVVRFCSLQLLSNVI